MAVDIRSVTTNSNNGSSATVAVTTSETPSATQIGDLVVVIHSNDFYTLTEMPTPTATGSPALTAITGGTVDVGTNAPHIKSYTYVANTAGAQTVSVTETGAAGEEKQIAAYVLSGADTGNPIDAVGTTTTSETSSHVLSAISPARSDSLLIAHLQSGGDFRGGSWTPPGSMSEQYDQITGGMTYTGATESLSASGSTGTRTFTSTVALSQTADVLIAINAVSVGDQSPRAYRYVMLRDWRLLYG